jgi:hypothetical protein
LRLARHAELIAASRGETALVMGLGAIFTCIVRMSAVVIGVGLTGINGRRIDPAVEDFEQQWFKMPARRDGGPELVRRDDLVG